MKFFKSLTLLITAIIIFSCNKSSSQTITQTSSDTTIKPVDKGWTFDTIPLWADEFDVDGKPDSTKWSYDIGGSGWGNHEKEFYTEAQNVTVHNGILSIEARKENAGGMNYTSARMVTKNKGDFLYGRFEIRAKLPTGKGLWPAIWMLPTDWAYGDWPKSGEVDIMEQVGFDPDSIHISTHTGAFNWTINTQVTNVINVPTATTDFHVYRIDWTPYAIRGFIDGVQHFQFINDGKGPSHWPFDKRFHILLNIAVGGDWGGQQGIDDSIFPAKMDVDYVRVYKMRTP